MKKRINAAELKEQTLRLLLAAESKRYWDLLGQSIKMRSSTIFDYCMNDVQTVEIQRLTNKVKALENELDRQKNLTKFFQQMANTTYGSTPTRPTKYEDL